MGALADQVSTANARDADAAQVGLCWDCGYSLRGLAEHRCPECGRPFDPADRETMNFGRPIGPRARSLLAPMSRHLYPLVALSAGAVLWGESLLPGGIFVSAPGLMIGGLLSLYIIARAVLRRAVTTVYQQPRIETISRGRRAVGFMVLTLVICALAMPARVIIWLHYPLLWQVAHRYYHEEPMLFPPPLDRVGLLRVRGVSVSPSGVIIRFKPSDGTLSQRLYGDRSDRRLSFDYGEPRRRGP